MRSRRICIISRWLTVSLAARAPAALGATEQPSVEYRATSGCPSRARFEQELLDRSSRRSAVQSEHLVVDIEFDGVAYTGRVHLSGTQPIAGRQVRHESCEQVLHAVALIGALLLEPDGRAQADESDAPPSVLAEAAGNESRPPSERADVVTLPPTKQKPSAYPPGERRIRAYTLGPWFALTGDDLAAPQFRLGPRLGVLLTLQGLVVGSQELLRLSAARIQSGTITTSSGRQANVTWSSVRLDACHGSGAHELSTIAGCINVDVGYLEGQGFVGALRREQGSYWARVGAGLYLRQRIVEWLTLMGDLGLMLSLSRPEFYFAETDDASEERIHRPSWVGPVADLGLELHFW